MTRVSVGFAAAATMAVMLAGAPSASAQEVLAASCEPRETALDQESTNVRIAQTFTPQLGGRLTRAEIDIEKLVSSGDWIVALRAVDGSGAPTETVLASVTIPDANVPLGNSFINAVFAAPPETVSGQTYALSITRTGMGFFRIGERLGDDCPGRLWGSSFGGAWNALDSSFDLVFRVFVTPPPLAASCRGHSVSIRGTEGPDEITGTPGRDVIGALGGKDEVRGLAGKDLICGGKGKDTLRGGKSKDKLYGQGGKDKLAGGGGKDRCVGGKKDDTAKKCEVEKSM